MVLSMMSLIFSMANSQGVFGQVIDQVDITYNISQENTSLTTFDNPLLPPKCEPVIENIVIPIVDDVGCMGATITWMNGLRDFESTNVWFIILFGIPFSVAIALIVIKIIRGN